MPEGDEPAKLAPPEVWEANDTRWPPIPKQDFSNLPRQQKGLHAKGFEYMRLSERSEGHISNFERTLDGFLAGLPYERLLPALQRGEHRALRKADRRHRLLSPPETFMSSKSFADVAEGVRATIAAYTHALDDGRTDDIVATFCADGLIDIPGMGDARRARRAARGVHEVGAAPAATPPRGEHARVRVERRRGEGDERRRCSCFRARKGWAVQIVGRYHDTLHCEDGTWRFHRRVAEFAHQS